MTTNEKVTDLLDFSSFYGSRYGRSVEPEIPKDNENDLYFKVNISIAG